MIPGLILARYILLAPPVYERKHFLESWAYNDAAPEIRINIFCVLRSLLHYLSFQWASEYFMDFLTRKTKRMKSFLWPGDR